MQAGFLAEIKSFKEEKSLNTTETHVTTSDGKKYVEKKNESGEAVISEESDSGLGFYCIDLTPDMTVGVAMDGVLVASQDVAHDLPVLKEHGVTHILNVAHGLANIFPDDFECMSVHLLDTPDQDFLIHYKACERFIDQGRAKGKVLVHCNAGRSRSTSIALAYVMHRERLPLDQALARLRETRPEVRPNEGFMAQLKTLEKELGLSN